MPISQPIATPAVLFIQSVLATYFHKSREGFIFSGQSGDLDWSFLEQWVAANGMEGVFASMLHPSILPDGLGKRWKYIHIGILVRNVRSLNTAIHLFSILEKAGIPATAMRGLTLAHREYGNPGMRTMEDIDVLVSPSRRFDLLAVLKRNGHEPEKLLRSQDVFRINGFNFEIHYSFLTAKRYRHRIDTDDFINSRRHVETKDGVFYCLSDENELIGLVTHAFIHHDLAVPKQLLDIALYMQKDKLDWEYVYQWCCSMKLVLMFSVTLQLVKCLFQLEVPGFDHTFGRHLSRRVVDGVDTYLYSFYGIQSFRSYLGHKRNMIYVAEGAILKLNQLACFLSVKEGQTLLSYLQRSRSAPSVHSHS